MHLIHAHVAALGEAKGSSTKY